jgi:hypothetical protein
MLNMKIHISDWITPNYWLEPNPDFLLSETNDFNIHISYISLEKLYFKVNLS